MKDALKQIARKGFHAVGLELTRHRPEATEAGRFGRLLKQRGIDLVVDVGANKGGFAGKVREAGYKGPLVSFEPLREVHRLLESLSAADPAWTLAPRMALGAEPGEATLHVAGNSSSSSLLPMLPTHAEAAPASAYVAEERVPVQRLDAALPALMGTDARRILLKIDTQGYERPVLEGAAGLLDRIDTLQLELSLVPLYEGQWLLADFLPDLTEKGFVLWSLSEVFSDPRTGQLLQVDGVFVREGRSAPGQAS